MPRTPAPPALLALAALAAPALGQPSSIDATNKFSWSENCGWMNWRDAGSPAASQGVRRSGEYLAGFIWAENIGWINVGSGSPANGTVYSNLSGADSGVNVDLGTGNLSGFAWGENVGWINFAAAAPLGTTFAARIDFAAGRFRGYAWGENIGWVNLDDATRFVGLAGACYANCDQSTTAPVLNVQDFSCFLNKFAAADPWANCDGSTTPPVLNVSDFACFLNQFAAGCP
jgi:hypothetical protein